MYGFDAHVPCMVQKGVTPHSEIIVRVKTIGPSMLHLLSDFILGWDFFLSEGGGVTLHS